MDDIFGLESLFPEVVLAIGLAMVLGNGLAIFKNRRGERPRGVEGEFRPGRAWFLGAVGVILAVWGGASVFS
ncbi:MAG: hypothetical protein OEM81_06180 [Acidimicrobiia bacterium]|nr:hypothetical protein [Acidimicrobiia bacterium]MDH3397408.1 hypothetical protein [Acidimicrobiia bacterium]